MSRKWINAKRVEMQFKTAQEQRLHDLALALIIPWADGFPQYWMNADNREHREAQIYQATEKLPLPWL